MEEIEMLLKEYPIVMISNLQSGEVSIRAAKSTEFSAERILVRGKTLFDAIKAASEKIMGKP